MLFIHEKQEKRNLLVTESDCATLRKLEVFVALTRPLLTRRCHPGKTDLSLYGCGKEMTLSESGEWPAYSAESLHIPERYFERTQTDRQGERASEGDRESQIWVAKAPLRRRKANTRQQRLSHWRHARSLISLSCLPPSSLRPKTTPASTVAPTLIAQLYDLLDLVITRNQPTCVPSSRMSTLSVSGLAQLESMTSPLIDILFFIQRSARQRRSASGRSIRIVFQSVALLL